MKAKNITFHSEIFKWTYAVFKSFSSETAMEMIVFYVSCSAKEILKIIPQTLTWLVLKSNVFFHTSLNFSFFSLCPKAFQSIPWFLLNWFHTIFSKFLQPNHFNKTISILAVFSNIICFRFFLFYFLLLLLLLLLFVFVFWDFWKETASKILLCKIPFNKEIQSK